MSSVLLNVMNTNLLPTGRNLYALHDLKESKNDEEIGIKTEIERKKRDIEANSDIKDYSSEA